tara:strand:+ start:100 stop:465 length:366 start_codon:yes stop_codon:yes gene_type:complete
MLIAAIFSIGLHSGAVYKCVDKDGNVRFTDKNVCGDSQPYSAPEPLLSVRIEDVAGTDKSDPISMNFNDTTVEGMLDLLADFAEIKLVNLVNSEETINVRFNAQPCASSVQSSRQRQQSGV